MKQDVEIMPIRPAAPDPAPAVTGPRALRTSSYVIYVDLPRDDRNMLLVHGYISRLRRVLVPHGPARDRRALIESAGASYRLRAGPGELDLIRFRQAAERGAAAAGRDPAAACDSYR
jgi:hypothetical protein